MSVDQIPLPIEQVLQPMPEFQRRCILDLRGLILDVARDLLPSGLTETLKWGQPAYLPGCGGTTIRLGRVREGDDCMMLVHCQTDLVETWRARFSGRLRFQGNRAILVAPGAPLPAAELKLCISDALTYHSRRRSAKLHSN